MGKQLHCTWSSISLNDLAGNLSIRFRPVILLASLANLSSIRSVLSRRNTHLPSPSQTTLIMHFMILWNGFPLSLHRLVLAESFRINKECSPLRLADSASLSISSEPRCSLSQFTHSEQRRNVYTGPVLLPWTCSSSLILFTLRLFGPELKQERCISHFCFA